MSLRAVLLAAGMLVTAGGGCSTSSADKAVAEAKAPDMTVDELDKQLASHQATPVDCNGAGTRKRQGVIPGAILLSDEETFKDSELPADKSARLVFYCGGPG